MRPILFLLALGLALHIAAGQEEIEDGEVFPACEGAPSTKCGAFGFLQIEVTGGSCEGSVSADCKTVTKSQNDIKEAYDDWFAEDGMCDGGKAEAAAQAVASAVAEVWANAAVKVSCEGEGFACGWAISNATTWAIAFAEAMAQAAAEAGGESDTEAFCFADIRAVSVVLADAATKAQKAACTTGETVDEFENNYAVAIQTGIAEAHASATARACEDQVEGASAESKCVGAAASKEESQVFGVGDYCAGVAKVKACTGPGKKMCCADDFERSICLCDREGDCNGPWRKQSDFDEEKNTKRSFADKDGVICFCLD